jgi:LPS sulfotransferase NodH
LWHKPREQAGMIIPPALRAIASPHRAALEAAFGPIVPNPAYPAPAGPVIYLCFTNRCGSNYLAQLLASTGACNEAGEFFNAETVLHHAARLGLRSLPAYMAALPTLVPPHPILAAKASADQLVMLADAGLLGPTTRYILLERRDRLAQAVSRVIAVQTLRWTTAHTAIRAAEDLHYDAAAIGAELDIIARGNAALYAFFAANSIAPAHLTYEDLLRDPVATVGERLGLPGLRARPGEVSLGRQAGAINRDWVARYRAE